MFDCFPEDGISAEPYVGCLSPCRGGELPSEINKGEPMEGTRNWLGCCNRELGAYRKNTAYPAHTQKHLICIHPACKSPDEN